MWTPACCTFHSKIMGINMESPTAAITASTLLGRLSTRCWNITAGTCVHSATRALVMSGTDVGRLGLARSRHSNSKVFDGVKVRARSKQVKFFHTVRQKNISVCTSPCARGHCHAETEKGLPQTAATKLAAQLNLECHCML